MADGVGVVASHLRESLAPARARHQILGLLLGGRHARVVLAFGGDQDFLQDDAFFAHEIRFVLVVILLDVLVLHLHLLADFLANHALRQEAVLHLLLEVFKGHAALFLDIGLELIWIGDLGIGLDGAQLLAHFVVDVDIEVLGLLRQNQLIDAIAQQVFLPLGELLLQRRSGNTGGAHGFDEFPAAAFKITSRDNVAVAFGDDLFHGSGRGSRGRIGGG